jgi:hypothetical protein
VPVETQLGVVREVRAEFEKEGTKLVVGSTTLNRDPSVEQDKGVRIDAHPWLWVSLQVSWHYLCPDLACLSPINVALMLLLGLA